MAVVREVRDSPPPALVWSLPGHGDRKPDCGQWRTYAHEFILGPVGDIGAEHHYRRTVHRCGRFACPECALAPGGWADRESRAIVARITVGVGPFNRPIHVVVSPPPSLKVVTGEDFRNLRVRAYRVAREAGFRGGCLVYHHLRLGSRRFNQGRSLGCRPGPHFHALGDGWIVPPKRSPDWVVKNLGVRKNLHATAAYLLSHASQGILPMPDLRGPEVVTWFGSMAYNKLSVPETDPIGPFCAVCEAEVPQNQWFRVDWVGQGPPPDDLSGVCERGCWERARFMRGDAPSEWVI